MYTVALTGGIGSGKSAAADFFAELGVPVTDVDKISHALTAANQPLVWDIAANFGNTYVTPEGALDRAAMRDLVFNDATARTKLNALLHPAIYEEAVKQLAHHADAPYQILVIPLLFESQRYMPHINRILVIDCDEAAQIERVKKRSKLPETEIKKIIATQTPRKKQLMLANDVIENNGNIENLRKKVIEIHKNYMKNV